MLQDGTPNNWFEANRFSRRKAPGKPAAQPERYAA
jgi:hypothetical protein